ncbi:hypothetical protein GGF41_008107, partial [Coemansia sp. RSA 2531]
VLPALVKFSGEIYGLGPELLSIDTNERPDHIASTYCDVAKNLQTWVISGISGHFFYETIDHILLLALVCP